MPVSKFKLAEGIGASKAGKQIQNFSKLSLQDNLTTCSMHKQNVKTANETNKIVARCHVVG